MKLDPGLLNNLSTVDTTLSSEKVNSFFPSFIYSFILNDELSFGILSSLTLFNDSVCVC